MKVGKIYINYIYCRILSPLNEEVVNVNVVVEVYMVLTTTYATRLSILYYIVGSYQKSRFPGS
jgi:hypothetical protein